MDETLFLEQCTKLFMRYGVKSVSMDDLARELGISKKTLYQMIEDKEELVRRVLEHYLRQHTLECTACLSTSENPVQQLLELVKYVALTVRNINPALLFDLQKYYPRSWQQFQDFRYQTVRSQILHNLELGKQNGWYRSDLEVDIASNFYIQLMDAITNTELFPPAKYRFHNLIMEMVFYHLHAVCSDIGRTYIQQEQSKLRNAFD